MWLTPRVNDNKSEWKALQYNEGFLYIFIFIDDDDEGDKIERQCSTYARW